jgi:hypothetical protein
VNDHHWIHYYEVKAPPVHSRTFLSSLEVKKFSDAPAVHVWIAALILKQKRNSAHDELHAVRRRTTRSSNTLA